MDPITIAGMVLGGAGKAAELAAQAIEAFKVGDDTKALGLLDQALAHLDASMPGLRAELTAAQVAAEERLAERFPEAPAASEPTHPEEVHPPTKLDE